MAEAPKIVLPYATAALMPDDRSPPGPSEAESCASALRVVVQRINVWLEYGASASQSFRLEAKWQAKFTKDHQSTLTDARYTVTFKDDQVTVSK